MYDFDQKLEGHGVSLHLMPAPDALDLPGAADVIHALPFAA
jgi:hypothetical protein